jgi:hypothetical protein
MPRKFCERVIGSNEGDAHMRKAFLVIAAAASLVAASTALAGNIDSTGHGFVGKGRVQSAFKWNNAKLQKNASNVSFSFSQSVNETAACDFNNQHITMHRGGKRAGSVSSQVAYAARTNRKGDVTGFRLNGLVAGSSVTQWGAWALDSGTNADGELSLCLSGGNPGPWLTSDKLDYGPINLYVNYGTTKIKLQ